MQTAVKTIPVVIDSAEAVTLPGLFELRARLSPEAPAYQCWSGQAGKWNEVTWQDIHAEASRWKAALAAEKINPGERIAVLLPNSLEWVCMEQAALALGLVPVALYNWDSASNIGYILADCDARLLMLETVGRARELASQLANLLKLQRIVALAGAPDRAAGKVMLMADWLARGKDGRPVPVPGDPNALATLIYTSGTTGRPKGVMLSHRNILDNAAGILEAVPPQPSDRFLSILPLAHAYERTVGYYVPMMAGLPVAFARSPRTIGEDLVRRQPTIMLVVPRLLERIYAGIEQERALLSPAARWIFDLVLAAGWRRFQAEQEGRHPPCWARLIWVLVAAIVRKRVMVPLGGKLRVMVSGGAPLSPDICRRFLSLGIPVLQGYGMTETSPVVSTNRITDNVPESAGLPITGCNLRIGEDGELLVRSSSVMLGYWRKPKRTREAIDREGWLHTGDIAEIRSGRLYVTGRLGDVEKLSTGHKVPVAAVEDAIVRDPLFHQAIVVASDCPAVKAIAVLDRDTWHRLAADLGVGTDDPAALTNERVQELALDRMAKQMQALPRYCWPQSVVLDLDPWSVEAGLLTPTLKPKRRSIMIHYAEQLDGTEPT